MIRPEDIQNGAVTTLSPQICQQLLEHGLSTSPAVTFSRNFMYNGPVLLFNNNKLIRSRLDAYTSVSKDSILTTMAAGRYCSIGDHVQIGMGIHNVRNATTSLAMYYRSMFAFHSGKQTLIPNIMADGTLTRDVLGEETSQVELEHDVWVGAGACFPKSVKVGTGAVIGAHTVVTKDVPPYAIVVQGERGSQVIGYRFSDEVISDLLASKWWRFDLPLYASSTGKTVPFEEVKDFIAFIRNEDLSAYEIKENWRYLEVISAEEVRIHQVSADFDMSLACPLLPREVLLQLRQLHAAQ